MFQFGVGAPAAGEPPERPRLRRRLRARAPLHAGARPRVPRRACRRWCGCRSSSASATSPPACTPPASSPATAARRSARYDIALWQAREHLAAAPRRASSRGVNEDLAATAVWGTQQATLHAGREVRRRVRHLVRQGPGRRPLGRRAAARQLRGHGAAGRRARARRRRPRREVVVDRAPVRAGADPPRRIPILNPSSVQEFLDFGAARHRDVALLRLLGRAEVRHRHGRQRGLGRGRPRARAHRRCRRRPRCAPAA